MESVWEARGGVEFLGGLPPRVSAGAEGAPRDEPPGFGRGLAPGAAPGPRRGLRAQQPQPPLGLVKLLRTLVPSDREPAAYSSSSTQTFSD